MAPRPPRGSPAARVWVLVAALATVTAALFGGAARALPVPHAGVEGVGWWTLAALFFAAETCVVHLEFRGEAHTFSLGEIALVLGLFTLDASHLVLAQLAGAAAALVVQRRQEALKVAFNLTNLALEAVLAALVWHALTGGAVWGPAAWGAAFAATLVASTVAVALVGTAIAARKGSWDLAGFAQTLAASVVVSVSSASIGLLGTTLLRHEPLTLWLLVAPAALTIAAYRGYASMRTQRDRLESLQESTTLTHRSLASDAIARSLLERAREMFSAERAEIALFGQDGGLSLSLGPDDVPVRGVTSVEGRVESWRVAAAAGAPVLVARRPGRRARGERGLRDAMVAPLYIGGGIGGTLLVGDRLGDVSTFGREDLDLFQTFANHAGVSLQNARLVEELTESLARMTEINRLKDDFVASVSHELRTPMTAIRGYVQVLLRAGAKLGEPERRSMLESVDRQGEQLWRLIDDLLVVSGIESPPRRRAGDAELEPVVATVVGASTPGEHPIDVDVAPDLPPVRADGATVGRILGKLVDNATKHTPAATPVTIRARRDGGAVVVAVEDRGPGIPEDARERIFDRFVQADQSSTRAVGGTGLGLYIARRLAEGLGGRVTLQRSGADGSVFALTLPAAERPGTAAGEQPVRGAPLATVAGGTA